MDVTETERLWILGLLLHVGGEDRGLIRDDIPEEFVSMEWMEEQEEEDSESFFWGSSGVSMGVTGPSSASEWFDSQDDTLTESILSPELPLAADLGCSLVGVLPGMMSDPRNSRLSLFTMLFRGLGEVVLASAAASISHERA